MRCVGPLTALDSNFVRSVSEINLSRAIFLYRRVVLDDGRKWRKSRSSGFLMARVDTRES